MCDFVGNEYISKKAAISALDRLAISLSNEKARFVAKAECVILDVKPADVRPAVRDTPFMEDAIEAVIGERMRQISLYGDQTGLPLLSWPGILGEEFGELCEAIGETASPPSGRRHPERGGWDNIYKEACHVAAVAVQIMETVKKKQEEAADGEEV